MGSGGLSWAVLLSFLFCGCVVDHRGPEDEEEGTVDEEESESEREE